MPSPAQRASSRVAGLIRQNADPSVIAAARRDLAMALGARQCSVEGCKRAYRAKGLCATHLVRLNRMGDPMAAVPVPEHGLSRHPLYSTWWAAVDRCHNPRARAYRLYGARGISVCPAWHDVAVFIEWIERNLGPRPAGFSLDRTDNDGNYEPGNVRWATRSEQRRNQRPRKTREPG
jgi:hypothetical protein